MAIGYASFDGTDDIGHTPIMTIINPNVSPTSSEFFVAQDVVVQQNDITTHESAPILEVLDDGRILAVFLKDSGNSSEPLYGRVFNADGTPSTDEFKIGTYTVDGTTWGDGYENNVYIDKLENGNIVIGIAKENSEDGGVDDTKHQPMINIINPSFTPNEQGFVVASDVAVRSQDNNGSYESAARVVALDDGGFLTLWYDMADTNDSATRFLYGRVWNEDGTPRDEQFQFTIPIDGYAGYNVPIVTSTLLDNGNVAIGWCQNSSSSLGVDAPVIAVIDPSYSQNSSEFWVLKDTLIEQNIGENDYSGPAQITKLDSGNFVAVWHDGAGKMDDAAIYYRIFDANGNALTDQLFITQGGDGTGMSNLQDANWDSIDVTATGGNNFVVGWMGYNYDGSGSSVLSKSIQIDSAESIDYFYNSTLEQNAMTLVLEDNRLKVLLTDDLLVGDEIKLWAPLKTPV